MTHAYAELTVSPRTYDEIARKLREAGWDHAFSLGVIDMHGVGLVRGREPERRMAINPETPPPDPDA